MLIRHAHHGEPANPGEGNLTALGIRQAEVTGDLLCPYGIERLFSSPYPRAMQTASIISRRVGLPVEVRVDLHNKVRSSERTPSRGRLLAMYPEATFPPSMTREWSPGEEEGKDVYSRLQGEVERLRLLESSHERIAIVSHAFILDALASILTGCPPKKEMRFWFDNCSLTLISCAGGVGRLHYLNLVGHLEARDLFFGG